MLKKRTVLIFAVLLFCCVGQLFLRSGSFSTVHATAKQADSNQPEESSAWFFDNLDPASGKDEGQNKLIRQFAIAVCFVVVLGGCALYFSKKFSGKLTRSRGKNISVVETIHLGPHKTLHLVEVCGGQTLLIGSTNENISILADVTEAVSGQLGPKPRENRGQDDS
jgi:flagellar biogenesis protein FliO